MFDLESFTPPGTPPRKHRKPRKPRRVMPRRSAETAGMTMPAWTDLGAYLAANPAPPRERKR